MTTRTSPLFRRAALAAAPVIALVLACSSENPGGPPTPSPTPRPAATASLGDDIALSPGEAVVYEEEEFAVAFHRVADDSRCPEGVTCVTAGTAVVVMSLGGASIDAGQMEFLVPPGGGGIVMAGPYTVTLESLEPDPPPEGGVDQNAYRVKFSVTR